MDGSESALSNRQSISRVVPDSYPAAKSETRRPGPQSRLRKRPRGERPITDNPGSGMWRRVLIRRLGNGLINRRYRWRPITEKLMRRRKSGRS